jgi:hypothetical protein
MRECGFNLGAPPTDNGVEAPHPMTLGLLITFGVLVCGWSFLSVLGNERQRKVQEQDAERAKADSEAPVGR